MKPPHCCKHEEVKSNKEDETVFRVDLFNEIRHLEMDCIENWESIIQRTGERFIYRYGFPKYFYVL